MAGPSPTGSIYGEKPDGRQVYVYATWKWKAPGKGVLRIKYVGCGMQGRSQHHQRADQDPWFQEWLRERWVPRTLLFAKPRRLEDHAKLQTVLAEYGISEGLVVFETPFLERPFLVEGKLIEIYTALGQADFNKMPGERPKSLFRPIPNRGSLRDHVPEIRRRKAEGEGTNALAREFGVDPASIRCVVRRSTYKDIP
jgi:hypothetical protein